MCTAYFRDNLAYYIKIEILGIVVSCYNRLKIRLVAMQEFLQRKHASDDVVVKTKSRSRRRASKMTRRSRTTSKGKSARVDYEPQSCVPTTVGVSSLSSKSEGDRDTQLVGQTAACGVGHADGKTLMYAKRMNSYIARTLTEDSEDEQIRSPPALTRVYSLSRSASVSSAEPSDLHGRNVTPGKRSPRQSARIASIGHALPAADAVTPSKSEAEIYGDSPAAKRRLFGDGSCFRQQTPSSDGNADGVGQVGRQNGYHTIEKLLTSSLNGKSLGVVDHYEDGLLAIANAACLMSTGALDHTRVSEGQGW